MPISGTVDDTKLAVVLLIASLFALVVLSPLVGSILVAYNVAYLITISIKPPQTYQWSSKNQKLIPMLILVGVIFAGFILVNDFIVGQFSAFSAGSSLALYSTSLNPIITINDPIVKFFIWGILIPILETFVFIGLVGWQLTKRFKVNGFEPRRIENYIIAGIVGSVAAIFHLVSQIGSPELLVMDAILFGTGMILTIKYNELKQAGLLHIMLNSVVMAISLGFIGGIA